MLRNLTYIADKTGFGLKIRNPKWVDFRASNLCHERQTSCILFPAAYLYAQEKEETYGDLIEIEWSSKKKP